MKKTFVVEQYELHAQTYTVEAEDRVDAMRQVLSGEVAADDNGLEYIQVDEELGMSLEQFNEDEVKKILGNTQVFGGGDYVPTVRNCYEHPLKDKP